MYKLDPSRVYLEIVDKFPKNSTCSTQTQIAKISQKKNETLPVPQKLNEL